MWFREVLVNENRTIVIMSYDVAGHIMPPLLHVYNGLARPANDSMLSLDTGKTGLTSEQRDTLKT